MRQFAGFLWLLWLWLLANSIPSSLSFDVSCCPEDAVWQYSANCSDGSKINLQCPYGVYLIDPEISEQDNFTVIYDDDTAWLVHTDQEKIPADR
jgi:hypothetical protein